MSFSVGDFARFTGEKRRRNSRGPIVLIVAERVPMPDDDTIKALSALATYTAADAKGTMTVHENELERLDPVSLIATLGGAGLAKIRFPVRLDAKPNPDGSGALLHEAICVCAGPLGLRASGRSESVALSALREQLAAIIRPPAHVEIVV